MLVGRSHTLHRFVWRSSQQGQEEFRFGIELRPSDHFPKKVRHQAGDIYGPECQRNE